MSGTGPTPAEQHLGDRLAALVDGELKHDARERVLAHLATCPKCKAEADAQRRLKSVFAQSAPPSPSEGFLARLQGLPGGPGGDAGPGGPFGGGGGGRFGDGLFPVMQPSGRRTGPEAGPGPLDGFGYLPAVHGSTAVLPGGASGSSFRIHEVGREADRSPWLGRRFAFAAASAVSLAAIALGGTLPLDSTSESPFRAEGTGSNVTPLDAEARAEGGNATADRRGGGGALSVSGDRPAPTSPASPSASASVAPAVAAPALATAPSLLNVSHFTGNALALPVLNVSVPPLIRPTGSSPLLTASIGGKAVPEPAEPTATASAFPPPTDHALPLHPRR
ncbi:zf-HC2 domain-containing protein [Streptomyces sp. NBC_00234]|uniref:anti-sigma factor family protein n=1 Tax=Streptomyces sp. NBC_00234 TaxID=2903638 RepID=UPI002E2DF19D|nr:zf-HC2 domain-containing protein [Streptomyces sp. NBC_00234]